MKAKRIISAVLSATMLLTSGGVINVMAQNNEITLTESEMLEKVKTDIIKDGDFENASFLPLDWRFKTYDAWYCDKGTAEENGNHYVSVSGSGVGKNVTVEPNTEYTLTARVRSTGAAKLYIQNGDATYPGTTDAVTTLASVDVTGTQWHTVELKYTTTDSSPTHLFVYLWSDGGVTTDIDDVKLFTEMYEEPEIDLGDTGNVDENLTLPTSSKGCTIAWQSSDASVIENNGTVHRPAKGRKKVTLTANITYPDNSKKTQVFDVIVNGVVYYDYILDVKNEKGVDIQPNMYGLFFEDINYAADGGLYAEMVENRSFEEIMHNNRDEGSGSTWSEPGYAWSAVDGTMNYSKTENPLHENNTHYLSFTGKSFKNKAYDGMYVEKNKEYNISLYARVGSYNGKITAKTVKDGVTGFSAELDFENSDSDLNKFEKNGWRKYSAAVKADNTVRYSDFIIELDNSATVDFDVISVMPADAVDGIFRKDLAEKLKDMKPGFLRFPGGCIIEGWDMANAYQWKDTVGAIEERKQNWNRWATTNPYNEYNQTYGLGYYEYFKLCEYLDCDPVPVQNVGMACEYQGGSAKNGYQCVPVYKEGTTDYTDEFYSYINRHICCSALAQQTITITAQCGFSKHIQRIFVPLLLRRNL